MMDLFYSLIACWGKRGAKCDKTTARRRELEYFWSAEKPVPQMGLECNEEVGEISERKYRVHLKLPVTSNPSLVGYSAAH